MTYVTRADGISGLQLVRFFLNSDGSRSPVFVINDDVDGYSGIGALGPYSGMVATTSSPIILASVRYTGSRRVQIKQYRFSPWIDTVYPYTNDQPITVALRKLEAYSVEDSGGHQYVGLFRRAKTIDIAGGIGIFG